MIKRLIYILFFFTVNYCLFPSQTKGQNERLDSLGVVLDRTPKQSLDKVRTLIVMSRALQKKSADKSLIYAQQALLIAERLNYQKGISDALYYIANAYKELDNSTKALSYYLRALKFYTSTNNEAGLALTNRNLGLIYFSFGDYPQALSSYLSALEKYQKINDQVGIAYALGYVGNIYAVSQNYEKALDNHNDALEIAEKLKNQALIGFCYDNLGDIYILKQDYKSAMDYFKKAEQIFRSLNSPENLAPTLVGMGDIFKKTGNQNEALSHYLEALDLSKNIDNREGIASAYLNIGDLYLRTKNYQRALDYFQHSLEIARELKLTKILRDNYQKRSQVFEVLNNSTSALANYKLFKAYHDSLYNQSQLTLLAEMEARFNVEGKERENTLLKQLNVSLNDQRRSQSIEIENKERNLRLQSLIIFAFLGIFVLAGALVYVLQRARIKSKQINAQLTKQNQEITRQKAELEKQSEQLVQTYLKITDSIRYAETIQKSILPSESKMDEILKEYFVISKAKEVVSGDFYWVNKAEGRTFVAVVDCTGHGVSGGFMTMIGHTLLNEIIQQGVFSPAHILELLNQGLANIIQRQNQEISIGMEIGLCCIEDIPEVPDKVKITYAGAKRPLLSIKLNGSLPTEEAMIELRGDRDPIGFASVMQRTYQNQEIIVTKGSLLYLSSDGYVDQADPNNKRIGSPKLKKILLENATKDLAKQKEFLEKILQDHQQEASQRDDITIMGVKV